MKYIALISCLLLGTGVVDASPARGGTNYIYYEMDTGCVREQYGVIYHYDTATSTINSQLQAMYDNGQRRVKLPIYFGHGLDTGTVMDSTGGDFSTRFRTNLTNLLAEIKSIGFEEIEIGMYAQGANWVALNTTDWSTWNEPIFDETFNLIYNLHPIFANSGLLYRIDLLPEGIPTTYASNYSVWLEYDQKLWNYYVYTFGKDDTVGFSVIPTADYVAQIPNVYGDSPFGNHGSPYLYDFHIYENAYSNFTTVVSLLNAQGYNPGWIIGEAFYNDSSEASALASAITDTGQSVFYVAQFPMSEAKACNGGSGPDTAPPFSFSNWEAYSF